MLNLTLDDLIIIWDLSFIWTWTFQLDKLTFGDDLTPIKVRDLPQKLAIEVKGSPYFSAPI